MPAIVTALYKFTTLTDPAAVRGPLLDICTTGGCLGTLLLAEEGINGTIAGPESGIDAALSHIRQNIPGCTDLDVNFSSATKNPFYRMKVKIKREIVTMGVAGVDPNRNAGTHVAVEDWNDLISDPDVIVVDTRNDYEVGIGTFRGALNPETTAFREFPDWFKRNAILHPTTGRAKKVAMFCTGGIRCEKATAYLKSQGIDEVFHLKGGILKYLEDVPENESLWEGECFVFDQRVAVRHNLKQGSYDLCHACRRPLAKDEMTSPLYQPGISCPHCHAMSTETQKARYRERQRQIELGKDRGVPHIGSTQNRKASAKPAD